MFVLDTFETHLYALMEALVKAAVTELRRLLTEAPLSGGSARQRPAAAAGPAERGGEDGGPAVTHITNQFVSLMNTTTKSVLEEIIVMVKVSLCEAGPRGDPVLMSPKPSRKSSTRKLPKSLEPPSRTDHIYCKADESSCEEINSGSESPPDGPSQDLTPKRDLVQDESNTSDTQNPPSASFRCPSCEKTFTRRCFMERHALIHSRPHQCSDCGKRFPTLSVLNSHRRKHTGEKLYRCSRCGTEFAYKSTFLRHMHKHTHAVKKPSVHTCSLCETEFSDTRTFQRHRCGALTKTFVCSVCPETFQSRQRLADHEDLHSGDRDFVCETCGERFLSSWSLTTHRVTHVQREDCCEELGLGCSDASVLRDHLRRHSGEKLFSCSVCSKALSHQSALKFHMLKHTGERPYVCEVCGKRCAHPSALENHMRTHTGKKPGQKSTCHLCGRTLSSACSLKRHMSVHTGEKAYSCHRCGKKSSSPGNLKQHMLIHLDQKRFGCNVCGRRFSQPAGLKQHRRIHTGEVYDCSVCKRRFPKRVQLEKHQSCHLLTEDGQNQNTDQQA